MDDTVKIIVGVTIVVAVGLMVREFSGANEPEEVRACASALRDLEHEAREEGTDTCREIDGVREFAARGVTAGSAGRVADSLAAYVDHPPYGCRSLSVEFSVANAIATANTTCSAAARAYPSE